MKRQPPRAFSAVLLLSLVLTAAFLLLPRRSALAAPSHQDTPDTAIPLQLGEYVGLDLANGETVDYVLTVPEAANYEVGIVDEEEAIAFDLIITDTEGNELFNDIFGSINLELEPGDVTLHFEAVDDARLEFAVLGNIGQMTEDIDAPGTLPAGGIFFSEEISEPVYATLTVPETAYPQQVTIYFQPGEDDGFYISAEGDGIGYVGRDSSETSLLRFWTHGGDFLITAEPVERRSQLQLIPFLSGPPVTIMPGETLDGTILAGETAVIYSLPLGAASDELTVTVDADVPELDITLVDRLYDGDLVETSFGEPTLTVTDIPAGQYYLIVETYDNVETDLPISVSVSAAAVVPSDDADTTAAEETTAEEIDTETTPDDAVEETPGDSIEAGATIEGLFEPGQDGITYYLDVEEPGTLVSLALASEVVDSDFDLEAGFREDEPIWSTFTIGSDDKLTFVAPVAARYYVRVVSNGGDGQFQLMVGDLESAPAINVNDLTWGSVNAGEDAAYQLDVTAANTLVSILLVGPEAEDLDVLFAGYDAEGTSLAYDSSYSGGSSEIVSALVEQPGIYEVVVSGEFSEGGNFVVLTRLEDPNSVARQWAANAVASSEYGQEGFSALQATGKPNTPTAGDYSTAWAPQEADTGEETLELAFEHSVVPSAVNVYETFNPGALTAIQAYNTEAEEWVTLWEGEAGPIEDTMRMFSPELTGVDFATNGIRLVLDTSAVEGWNEIDAVELLGRP